MIQNPTRLSWTDPTTNTDGTPFGPDDFAGYDFGYRTDPGQEYALTVSVPVAYGDQTLDIAVLDLPQTVPFQIAMRTVSRRLIGGLPVTSAWTNPIDVVFDKRVPSPPLDFSVV